MQDQLIELAELGKALPPEERSLLVDMLLESLHEEPLAEVEAAWDVEVERRLAACRSAQTSANRAVGYVAPTQAAANARTD